MNDTLTLKIERRSSLLLNAFVGEFVRKGARKSWQHLSAREVWMWPKKYKFWYHKVEPWRRQEI